MSIYAQDFFMIWEVKLTYVEKQKSPHHILFCHLKHLLSIALFLLKFVYNLVPAPAGAYFKLRIQAGV